MDTYEQKGVAVYEMVLVCYNSKIKVGFDHDEDLIRELKCIPKIQTTLFLECLKNIIHVNVLSFDVDVVSPLTQILLFSLYRCRTGFASTE